MTIGTWHWIREYGNTAPFRVQKALTRRPPSWCECTGRCCGAPRRRRGSHARHPLSEDSKEPRNREPPWSRGQACHQYPHEDGGGPSGGARCHITRRHITTHLHTRILHFYLSLNRSKHGTRPSFANQYTVFACRHWRDLSNTDSSTECVDWMFVEPPSWFDRLCCRSGTRQRPRAGGRTRTGLPGDHTRDKSVSLTRRGAKPGKIKALNEAAMPPATYDLLHIIKSMHN